MNYYETFIRAPVDPDDVNTRVVIALYAEVNGGAVPRPGIIRQMLWRLLYENHTHWSLREAYRGDAPPVTPPMPTRRGVDIPVRALTGGWLYADPFWSPAHVFVLSQSDLRDHLAECRRYGNICVSVANFVGGDQWSPRHYGWDDMGYVADRLQYIDSQGIANVVFGMGNDYLRREIGFPDRSGWADDLARRVRIIGERIRDYTTVYIPLTERGKTLTSDYNRQRRRMYAAAREGMGDRGWIGAHELPGEGVYFEDLKDAGDCLPCIQTGFDRSEDEIRRWIRDDAARWRNLRDRGNFSGETRYCAFEHSIPRIAPRWPYHQTWEQAQQRGRVALDAGADLDFNGGQRK